MGVLGGIDTFALGLVGLSRLKESVAPSEVDRAPSIKQRVQNYPFATVLRLRVLQIVCGISFLIIGTVAFIEEQGKMNLGLGIPAGGATIIAAAASIHTTKGFSGYRTSTCVPGSFLRFLGPTIRIAIPLTLLWTTSCSVIGAIIVQSTRIIGCFSRKTCDNMEAENIKDLMVLSVIELSLSLVTLSAVFVLFRIDCKYDPD